MEIALLMLSVICFVAGFAGCVLPVLPGPPLSYVGMLLLRWSGYAHLSTTSLIVWAVVAVAVSVVDFFLTPWMTRRFGGSNGGSWGAVIGLVVGMFLPWPFGPLFGPFAGALVGEIIMGRQQVGKAAHAAFGSFLSFFAGTGVKLLVCGGMLAASICAI